MFLRAVSVLFALALIASFLGAWHGVGDSLAVFRLIWAGALFCTVLACRWRSVMRWALLGLAGVGAASVGGYKWAGHAAGPIAVYQKNMFFENDDLTGLSRDILAQDVDVVTLQEVSLDNAAILETLRARFPHQHLCRYTDKSGLAVLSRFAPAGEPVCGHGVGMAAMPVSMEGQVVTVVSIHLTWPYPLPQAEQVDRLEARLARMNGPMVIGGDFNMVPWSDTLRSVMRASATRRTGPSDDSFRLKGVPLPIDHVLAPGGGRREMRPLLGSDHRGIVARVHPAGAE